MSVILFCVFEMHNFNDLQVAIMCQEMQQLASKGREEEDCKPVYIDVNNTGVKVL